MNLITQAIDRIKIKINNAFDAIASRGGTVDGRKLDNLVEAIESIPSGEVNAGSLTYVVGYDESTVLEPSYYGFDYFNEVSVTGPPRPTPEYCPEPEPCPEPTHISLALNHGDFGTFYPYEYGVDYFDEVYVPDNFQIHFLAYIINHDSLFQEGFMDYDLENDVIILKDCNIYGTQYSIKDFLEVYTAPVQFMEIFDNWLIFYFAGGAEVDGNFVYILHAFVVTADMQFKNVTAVYNGQSFVKIAGDSEFEDDSMYYPEDDQ